MILLYWIPNVMVYYGGMSRILGILGLLILSAYISIFYGLSGSIIKKIVNSPKTALLLIPSVWISKDLILEKLFGGFPWEFIGYSQFKNTLLIQSAEIGGIHLISFIIVFINVALYIFIRNRDKQFVFISALIIISFYISGYYLFKHDILIEKDINANKVGIIQPNTGQNYSSNRKWRNVTLDDLFNKSINLKEKGAEFVVWPEYSIGLAPLQNKFIYNKLSTFAREHLPLFAGFTDYKNSKKMFNSIMLFKKYGFEKYDKVKLVPFGEYIPLKKIFFFVNKITDEISDFSQGEAIFNLKILGRKVSTPICYEIIYPEIVRDFVNNGGEGIILISNDSWYGTTSAPYQLLSMSVFRAIENRRYILRSTSNGISAIIDPRGNVIKKIPLNSEDSFVADFRFRKNLTIFTKLGFIFPYITTLFVFFLLLAYYLKKRKRT